MMESRQSFIIRLSISALSQIKFTFRSFEYAKSKEENALSSAISSALSSHLRWWQRGISACRKNMILPFYTIHLSANMFAWISQIRDILSTSSTISYAFVDFSTLVECRVRDDEIPITKELKVGLGLEVWRELERRRRHGY